MVLLQVTPKQQADLGMVGFIVRVQAGKDKRLQLAQAVKGLPGADRTIFAVC